MDLPVGQLQRGGQIDRPHFALIFVIRPLLILVGRGWQQRHVRRLRRWRLICSVG